MDEQKQEPLNDSSPNAPVPIPTGKKNLKLWIGIIGGLAVVLAAVFFVLQKPSTYKGALTPVAKVEPLFCQIAVDPPNPQASQPITLTISGTGGKTPLSFTLLSQKDPPNNSVTTKVDQPGIVSFEGSVTDSDGTTKNCNSVNIEVYQKEVSAADCSENSGYICTDWSECMAVGAQTRKCTLKEGCPQPTEMPSETQVCTPNGEAAPAGPSDCTIEQAWSCGDWSSCDNSKQTRTCTKNVACLNDVGKPMEEQACVVADADQIPENPAIPAPEGEASEAPLPGGSVSAPAENPSPDEIPSPLPGASSKIDVQLPSDNAPPPDEPIGGVVDVEPPLAVSDEQNKNPTEMTDTCQGENGWNCTMWSECNGMVQTRICTKKQECSDKEMRKLEEQMACTVAMVDAPQQNNASENEQAVSSGGVGSGGSGSGNAGGAAGSDGSSSGGGSGGTATGGGSSSDGSVGSGEGGGGPYYGSGSESSGSGGTIVGGSSSASASGGKKSLTANKNMQTAFQGSAASEAAKKLHGAYIQGGTGPEVMLYPILIFGANGLYYVLRRRRVR